MAKGYYETIITGFEKRTKQRVQQLFRVAEKMGANEVEYSGRQYFNDEKELRPAIVAWFDDREMAETFAEWAGHVLNASDDPSHFDPNRYLAISPTTDVMVWIPTQKG